MLGKRRTNRIVKQLDKEKCKVEGHQWDIPEGDGKVTWECMRCGHTHRAKGRPKNKHKGGFW